MEAAIKLLRGNAQLQSDLYLPFSTGPSSRDVAQKISPLIAELALEAGVRCGLQAIKQAFAFQHNSWGCTNSTQQTS